MDTAVYREYRDAIQPSQYLKNHINRSVSGQYIQGQYIRGANALCIPMQPLSKLVSFDQTVEFTPPTLSDYFGKGSIVTLFSRGYGHVMTGIIARLYPGAITAGADSVPVYDNDFIYKFLDRMELRTAQGKKVIFTMYPHEMMRSKLQDTKIQWHQDEKEGMLPAIRTQRGAVSAARYIYVETPWFNVNPYPVCLARHDLEVVAVTNTFLKTGHAHSTTDSSYTALSAATATMTDFRFYVKYKDVTDSELDFIVSRMLTDKRTAVPFQQDTATRFGSDTLFGYMNKFNDTYIATYDVAASTTTFDEKIEGFKPIVAVISTLHLATDLTDNPRNLFKYKLFDTWKIMAEGKDITFQFPLQYCMQYLETENTEQQYAHKGLAAFATWCPTGVMDDNLDAGFWNTQSNVNLIRRWTYASTSAQTLVQIQKFFNIWYIINGFLSKVYD